MPKFKKTYIKGGIKVEATSKNFKTREELESVIDKMKVQDAKEGIDAHYVVR